MNHEKEGKMFREHHLIGLELGTAENVDEEQLGGEFDVERVASVETTERRTQSVTSSAMESKGK